ncbi:MAG TPA: RusA family crossover junction endodeoxyribonuclease [Propionicimonas sp.]|jgi:hypothetical protein
MARFAARRVYARDVPQLPWECVVLGVPASVQGSSSARKRWKAAVAFAARAAWPIASAPLDCQVSLRLTYFHDGAPLDADNMIKPTQDALIEIVFVDDNQVRDVHASLRDLNESYIVRGLSPTLAQGFMSNEPFVYVQVEDPPDPRELP